MVTEISFSFKNLVTEMSFYCPSIRSETAASSRRKSLRAEVRNLVTEMSLSSRNLAVEVPKNWITVISRYFVTAMSSARVSKKLIVDRNLVTEMSSGF